MIDYRNLDCTESFAELKAKKPFDIKNNLCAERIEKSVIGEAGSPCYN